MVIIALYASILLMIEALIHARKGSTARHFSSTEAEEPIRITGSFSQFVTVAIQHEDTREEWWVKKEAIPSRNERLVSLAPVLVLASTGEKVV